MTSDFQRSAGRWQKVEELCGFLDASLGDVAQRVFASERHAADEKLERLQTMRSCALEIARIGAEAKGRTAACKEMARKFSLEVNGQQAVGDVEEEFNKGVSAAQQQAQRTSLMQAAEVVRVEKLMKRVSGEDDEIEVMTGAGSAGMRRCPFLNTPIENPVKSTVCGHVYDQKGVITALYQERGIRDRRRMPTSLGQVPREFEARCPVVGCQYNISAEGMKRDFDAELTQRKQQSVSAMRDSVEGEAEEVEVL